MNFQRQTNRFILVTSIFSFLTFVFALSLIALVISYKIILVSDKFSSFSNEKDPKLANGYVFQYIQTNGLADFFSKFGGGSFWSAILTFYILAILFAIINCLMSGLILIIGYKLKNSNLVKLGFLIMFGSIIGSCYGFKAYFKYRNIVPDHGAKSKLKTIESSLLSKLNTIT